MADNDELLNDVTDVEEDEEDGVLELEDEEGNTVRFEFLDLIDYENEQYAVLLPVEGLDLTDMVVVLRLVEEDGEQAFERVDDDAVQAVFALYKEKHPEEFDDGE